MSGGEQRPGDAARRALRAARERGAETGGDGPTPTEDTPTAPAEGLAERAQGAAETGESAQGAAETGEQAQGAAEFGAPVPGVDSRVRGTAGVASRERVPRPGDAARLALRAAAAAKDTENGAADSGSGSGSGSDSGSGPNKVDTDRLGRGGIRTESGVDWTGSGGIRTESGVERPALGGIRTDSGADRIDSGVNRTGSDADRPGLDADRTGPDADRTDVGAASSRVGGRPGDIAREALRAAREERRRAAAAAAEAAAAAPARAARPLPSPASAAATRHRTARDLKQFLATAFRMPPDEDEPAAPEQSDNRAGQGTPAGLVDDERAVGGRLPRVTGPAHTHAPASAYPGPTDHGPATGPRRSEDLPRTTGARAAGAPAQSRARGRTSVGGTTTGTPASPFPGHPVEQSATGPQNDEPLGPTSATPSRHPETDTPTAAPHHPAPDIPTTPRLPRTMATPHRDSELRRTFAALPVRAGGSGPGFAETWWGNAWVRALEEGALDVKRLVRGRSYAERGQVDAITVTPGLVLAYVQGSRPRPYRVQVRLRTFGEDEWERFLEAAADRPGDIAALLDKELPQALADSGVALLPGPGELEPRCSCPDFGHPCKHAAALCYQTARLLDADPFVLLLLRGRGEREVLDALSRRNAARAARERQPTALPGVRATEVLVPRQLPPLPAPLPVPPHPEQPPVYPAVPGGPDPFALDQLATDAAARAHALLATGRDPVGELTLWQDAVRLAAARPGSGLTASTRALYATLADAVGRTPGDLARAVAAWRQGGVEGLAVLEEPWDPPAGRFDRARPLLLAADLPVFRPWHNHLTHPGGHVQLRLGRDGLWYAYESEPGHDDWWPRGTPDLDPVGALTGLGMADDGL
ncbi:SWIM zinc finger family protein [Streptomyces sp. NPDC048277]|uniref:SWIM zinc finger family protein n=1 Tax=Streptomyces sp. NPDC048277 TaxID=3155027 RepID=UPI0033E298FA